MKNKVTTSPLIDKLVEALRCLPSVGPKSAQRMAFYLLQHQRKQGLALATTLEQAMSGITHCEQCNNFCESVLCCICSDKSRQQNTLCIVEMPGDLLAIEQSGAYSGLYFVLMGRLSPLDGIGPEQLNMPKLKSLLQNHAINEVILALNPTVEGEATAHYISELLQGHPVKQTQLAHGVPMGGELEYLDAFTIGKAIQARASND